MENSWYSLNSKVEKISKEKKACRSSNSKLEKPSEEESECTIYRVHRHLRTVNDGAYEPEVIAIGPYHHDKDHFKDHLKDHLKMMENHKWRNLESLVERRGKKADVYARAVSGEKSLKARKCYADHQDFKLTDSQFIEMLVLDGCFIVELVRKFADGCLGGEKDDPIFQMEWMITSLRRDLMLFENQIPFFVLHILFDHIKRDDEIRTLPQLLKSFFIHLYPVKGRSEELLQADDEHEIKHLLDLIHHNWVLPRLQQLNPKKCQTPNAGVNNHATDQVEMGSGTPLQETEKTEFKIDMLCNETEVEMASGTPLQDEEDEVEMGSGNEENILCINHATELTEANVEFKKEENETLLFDVYFEDGVMVMLPLLIEDGTECFLRNLIVYEQYFGHQLPDTVVTDYMMLLDNLIDSAKDVALLSKKGIIINLLGDAEAVANMVNKLGHLVTCGGSNFSYATEFEQVNEHCEKRWNRWMAKLRRDYLNSPWAIISIIAAVVLLLLTLTQTVLSILQVVQEH